MKRMVDEKEVVKDIEAVEGGIKVLQLDGTSKTIPVSGGGGDAVWGGITGTLSDQTDLQNALNSKADTSSLPLFDNKTIINNNGVKETAIGGWSENLPQIDAETPAMAWYSQGQYPEYLYTAPTSEQYNQIATAFGQIAERVEVGNIIEFTIELSEDGVNYDSYKIFGLVNQIYYNDTYQPRIINCTIADLGVDNGDFRFFSNNQIYFDTNYIDPITQTEQLSNPNTGNAYVYCKLSAEAESMVKYHTVDNNFISEEIARTSQIPEYNSQLINDTNYVSQVDFDNQTIIVNDGQIHTAVGGYKTENVSYDEAKVSYNFDKGYHQGNSSAFWTYLLGLAVDDSEDFIIDPFVDISLKFVCTAKSSTDIVLENSDITSISITVNSDGDIELQGISDSFNELTIEYNISSTTIITPIDSSFIDSDIARVSQLPDAVSGTNDGTNWTSLTIGSDTYGIGGGSAPSNMVTTDTTQTITAKKTINLGFNQGVGLELLNCGLTGGISFSYSDFGRTGFIGTTLTNDSNLALNIYAGSPGDTSGVLIFGQGGNGGTYFLKGATATNNKIVISDLPTTDPQVAGQLWNDNGTLKVSSGQ